MTSYLSQNEAKNLQNSDVHIAQIPDLEMEYLRTIWRMEVGDGSFFRIFHALACELNFSRPEVHFKVDGHSHFFLFVFLRDQNSQHFNEDLLAVNASAFSFVLCFKAINCTGTSNYAIIAN